MNIKQRIEQLKSIALAIPNVKSFKDLNIEALSTDKYIDEPVVCVSTDAITFDNGAVMPVTISALSQVDVERTTFRDVQDICFAICYSMRVAILDNRISSDVEGIDIEPVQADNNFIGFQFNINIFINPCN